MRMPARHSAEEGSGPRKIQTSPHLSVSNGALSEWRPSDNVKPEFK